MVVHGADKTVAARRLVHRHRVRARLARDRVRRSAGTRTSILDRAAASSTMPAVTTP